MIGDKNNPQRSPVSTDQQLLLMKWFDKNQHSNERGYLFPSQQKKIN
jgi:hypothetical protein